MKKILGLLSGAAAGAGLMYILDPRLGKSRRAFVRDQSVSLAHRAGREVDRAIRDLGNRSRGVVADLRPHVQGQSVDDDVLFARVRAELGHCTSHSGSLDVTVRGGNVTLRGPVLAAEHSEVIRCVKSVPGVNEVEDALQVRESPGKTPGLQGRAKGTAPGFSPLRANWPPAVRLISGVAGGLLASAGMRRGGVTGTALTASGLAMLTRSFANREMRRILGGKGTQGVDLQKTITIKAPVDLVNRAWTAYENFPWFMSHVQKVVDLGEGRSRWTVAGPVGTNIEWTAVLTRTEPNRLIAWETEPGSTVQHSGIVRFESDPSGNTRVQVRLCYSPPAGAAGHIIAQLLGADPRRKLNEDLLRMKTFIETGIPPRDAARKPVSIREELSTEPMR